MGAIAKEKWSKALIDRNIFSVQRRGEVVEVQKGKTVRKIGETKDPQKAQFSKDAVGVSNLEVI